MNLAFIPFVGPDRECFGDAAEFLVTYKRARTTLTPEYSDIRFKGACVDSGAQMAAIRDVQARANTLDLGVDAYLRAPKRTFRFGNVRYAGLGTIDFDLPIFETHSDVYTAEIANVNVPHLLTLDALLKMHTVLDFMYGVISAKFDNYKLLLTRKNGLVYVTWGQW